VVTLLLADHEEAKAMFGRFGPNNRSEWPELFCDLTETLVRHEIAEEEVVFPEVRKVVPDGDHLADARIAEQQAAEELLSEMERLNTDDDKFRTSLQKLEVSVLDHAKNEEESVFTKLRTALDQDRREELGRRYQKAKASAPTHPHPHAPNTPPGNLMMGPVAALVDRIRDAVRKG
jgi:hemerythrin superfamily protein